MKLLLLTVLLISPALALAARSAGDAPKPADGPFAPGAEHALVQQLAGTWDAVLTMPGTGDATKTRGTLTTTKVGAFHLADAFEGELMGAPMTGHGIRGYCTLRKQHFSYWVDSMTSSPLTAYGSYDEKKRELSLAGECLGASGKLEKCRTVTRFVDADHYEFALYGAGPDGREAEHLRIAYTRRK